MSYLNEIQRQSLANISVSFFLQWINWLNTPSSPHIPNVKLFKHSVDFISYILVNILGILYTVSEHLFMAIVCGDSKNQ